MKKLLFIFAAVAILASCTTPQSNEQTPSVDSTFRPQVEVDTNMVIELPVDSIGTDSVN
jgi:uncharacterized lipoprotein YajG